MKKFVTTTALLALSAGELIADEQIKLPVSFNSDGTINRPLNHRQWVNVGTILITKGEINIIDELPIPTSEYIDTYVEPMSYAIYMAPGTWPNGTQIVKEFTATKEAELGEVLVESHYNGLAMLVKDAERFPAETGHLGYFNFGHHSEPYETTAYVIPQEQCSSCHEASASEQQFIFADHHIGLRRVSE
ncbi:cytochrome P460 family protein [Ruegeria lacuscaerulensis]|uniref:cytochrome P460 family protein n=1 Tax=Ruegeria lacuscaerulensis TaxID=55218 RepID=UPI001480FC47|nr:cytochrome P460 family protein [Ruegeria lacuscaerulensis]